LPITLGVINEVSGNENRVALVPEDARKLGAKNIKVIIQSGAGKNSGHPDSEYISANCDIIPERSEVLRTANVILMLGRPEKSDIHFIRKDSILIGLIYPVRFQSLVQELAEAGIQSFSLELLPRTTRAQSMDVLSSQSAVAGYRAAIEGAFYSPRLMPMLTTAAGTVKPANVLVIGAGVGGLMAIATAKRLGASVVAYDVRKTAGDDVRSLGAKFLGIGVNAEGTGGYARELTDEEKRKEKEVLEASITSSDLIITTAGVPGKKAPIIINKEIISKMRPGAVIVDIMADSGGNCEATQPGKIIEIGSVKIIGPINPQSEAPINASEMFSRNALSFLSVLIGPDGNFVEPEKDDLLIACLVCRNGKVTYPPSKEGGEKK
jgi:NAD(P) transhydrogenase subunit alpha